MAAMAAAAQSLLLVLVMAALVRSAASASILQAGSSLTTNEYLESGEFFVVMQGDCNLVIYRGSTCCPTWSTGTWESGTGCTAAMQEDRDFVVYGASDANDTRPVVWRTNTQLAGAIGAYYLVLGDDGSLQVRQISKPDVFWSNIPTDEAGAPVPAPGPAVSVGAPAPAAPPVSVGAPLSPLPPLSNPTQAVDGPFFLMVGSTLPAGSSLNSGDFKLTLEPDCNLRSKNERGDVLWETGSDVNSGECELILRVDGNFLIQNSRTVIWESDVRNPEHQSISMLSLSSDDGMVSVLDESQGILWTSTRTLPPQPPPQPQPENLAGLIGGITGGIVAGGLLVGVVFFGLRHYGYFDKAQKELQVRLQNKGGRSRALTLHQIRKATKKFERQLGRGGFGPVYYGRLQDGQEVAVKVLSATSHQGKQEFFNEIELLSVVHHKYLVSLVGYCIEWKQRILVYEYMSGGDLRDRLHGLTASTDPLSWTQRKNIILQVAEGIQYLHEGCRPAIIHRDIKSNNILLDERVVAKIADFGLSKLVAEGKEDATHITTAVKGTTGYLDPEYYISQKLTEKSDVYAFGVLLMEILTGRSLVNENDHTFIVQKVRVAWKSKQLDELADPNLGLNYGHKEFSGLVKTSLWCVKQSSTDRPSMSQLVHELREIGVTLTGGSHPFDAVAGEGHVEVVLPYPLESKSSSKLKTDMSDPLISPFSISSSSSTSVSMFSH